MEQKSVFFPIENEKTTNLTSQKRLILIEHDLSFSIFEADLIMDASLSLNKQFVQS